MSERNTILRTLHDVGLAAWFGGSLMGAIGVNGAAATVSDPRERASVANAGWDRWTPVNAAAIGAHLIGAAGLLYTNRDRVANQQGVATSSAVKTALTAAALGLTAYSRTAGSAFSKAGAVPVEGTTESSSATPQPVAEAQDKLKWLQWAIPATTGALIAASALQGEQQRADEQARGVLGKAAQRLHR